MWHFSVRLEQHIINLYEEMNPSLTIALKTIAFHAVRSLYQLYVMLISWALDRTPFANLNILHYS
jgi:hypothetical protein